ncbi:MAG: xylulokinase [Saccharofermentanales bacterium]
MEHMCVIGIDVGTSGVKVIAVDAEGSIIASAAEGYPLLAPAPGWTEQNPSEWWAATLKALRNVVVCCKGYEIKGVGLSGQMHGMVALDGGNQVVRNAILWNDQRTARQCDEIIAAAGGLDALLRATNNNMLTGYTAGKILWMKETEPDNYVRTKQIVNPKDYIRYLLTGTLSTDVSDASGFGLYDVRNNVWNDDLIEILGLDRSMFPSVTESGAISGFISAEVSQICNLPAGTPVVAGGGDAVISTTGLGLIKPGRIAVTLGTSGVVAMGLSSYMDNPGGSLQIFRGNQPGTFVAMGVTLSAAGSYHWFRNTLGRYEIHLAAESGESAFALLDREAGSTAPGADGLIFLPYLNGERCPVNDPDAKGGFIGLSAQHKIGHFARSVLEGVAFSMRQVYELMLLQSSSPITSEEVVLAGGGASSPLWRQIMADVFDLPVRTVYGSPEGGSFGAALLAGVSTGLWGALEETVPLIRPESETLPVAAHVEIYKRSYEKYVRLYDALKWSF